MSNTDSLVDTRAAAALLGVSEWTLRSWRVDPDPSHPPFVRVGPKTVRYSPAALARWAEGRQCRPPDNATKKSHDPGRRKASRGRG